MDATGSSYSTAGKAGEDDDKRFKKPQLPKGSVAAAAAAAGRHVGFGGGHGHTQSLSPGLGGGPPSRPTSSLSHRSTKSVHSQQRDRSVPPSPASEFPPSLIPSYAAWAGAHAQHGEYSGDGVDQQWIAVEQRELLEDRIEAEEARRRVAQDAAAAARRHERRGAHTAGAKSIHFEEPQRADADERTPLVTPEVRVERYTDDARAAEEGDQEEEDAATSASDSDSDSDPMRDPLKWAAIREGSIARRSRWRKPAVSWLLPLVVSMALSLGMGVAPKQELYINLACLAHPPRTSSSSVGGGGGAGEMTMMEMTRRVWNAQPGDMERARLAEQAWEDAEKAHSQWRDLAPPPSTSLPENVTITPNPIHLPPLTPADKWMLDVQRRMAAEAERKRRLSQAPPGGNATHSQPPMPTSTSSPTGRVPHGPVGGLPPTDGDSEQPIPDRRPPARHNDEPDARPGEIDPRICKRDPKTIAAAAKLSMTMTLCMGILSAITTGFWGATSDRLGRTVVMYIALCGLVANDGVLLLTATYPDKVPGGYRFLVVGPIIEGLLGGFSTITATYHAYISDVTPDGSRAKIFSRMGGIMMAGFSVGPVLGSGIIKLTDNILSVFYVSASLNTLFVFFVALVLPESLSSEARAALHKMALAKRLKARQTEQAEIDWEREDRVEPGEVKTWGDAVRARLRRLRGSVNRTRRRAFGFLSPLAMFLPKDREVPDGRGGYKIKRDFNMTLLVAAGFCGYMLMGMYQLKGQFVIYSYGWTSVELGPFMTVIGACRGITMLVIFPLVVKVFKPKVKMDTTASEENALDASLAVGVLRTPQTLADSKFDLTIMRLSWAVDIVCYAGLSFVEPAAVFVALSAVISIGSAAGAAMNSLALNLLDSQREAGALFGAMSVVQAISSSFLGPLIFSMLFANTVGWYAPTIFAGAAVLLVLAQLILAGIDLPAEYPKPDVERGRTRVVKRVKSSSGVQRVDERSMSSDGVRRESPTE